VILRQGGSGPKFCHFNDDGTLGAILRRSQDGVLEMLGDVLHLGRYRRVAQVVDHERIGREELASVVALTAILDNMNAHAATLL
jgi:hypothetical protein